MLAQTKKKSSIVWEFFKEDPEEKLYAICTKCNERIKRGVSVEKCSSTPLHSHLQSKHANDLCDALKRKSNEGHPENQPPLKQRTIQDSLESSSYHPNSSQHISITRSIAKMIALDCQPFSIVTDEGFRTLMQVAKPRYKMPTRRKVTETIVEAHKLQVMQIKKDLDEDADFVNVTTDIWSSRNLASYLGVTGQWASKANGELKIRCLAVRSMSGSHTGENIDTYLKGVFDKYGKVFVILRDNASNMARAMLIGGYATYGCSAHSEQLCLVKVYENQLATRDVVHRIRKIVTHFHRSGKATEELHRIQVSLNLPQHKLIQDVETRWNSTYYMLKHFIEQRPAISQYLEDNDTSFNPLNGNEWKLAMAMTTIFSTFEEATRAVSEENATLSMVITITDVLRSTLEDLEDNGVGTIKQDILDSLHERFGSIEESPLLLVATLLDPRCKDKIFSSNEVCRKAKEEVLKIYCDNESLNAEAQNPEAVQVQSEKLTIWDKMVERMMKHGRPGASYNESHETDSDLRSMEVALNMYCAEEVIPLRGNGFDPFQYWQTKKALWPKMAQIATKYLIVPPGSVYSERLFSNAGLIDTPNRSRLTGEHLEQLTQLKVNHKIWPW